MSPKINPEKRFNWWWRKGRPGVVYDRVFHNTELENHYELIRRHADFTDLPPFPELSQPEQYYWADQFSPEDAVRPYADQAHGIIHDHHGWYRLSEWEWNLRATDNALVLEFKTLIQQQRKNQKIRVPKGLTGQKNHSVTWRWPELLDLKDKGGQTLEKNDKKLYRRAKATAENLAESLRRTVVDYIESSTMGAELQKPSPFEVELFARMKRIEARMRRGRN